MDFLQQLMQSIGQPQQQARPQRQAPARQPQRQRPIDPIHQGYDPEITYNPNPNKNIPYSAHTMEDAILGNEYMKDPTNPKFLGVDPARFGFPEDVGQYGGPGLLNQQQKNAASFKMFEDGSYRGNPQHYKQSNPGYKFYEDNSFSAPQGQAQKDPIAQLRQLLGF